MPSEKALKQKESMYVSILDTKIKILKLEIEMVNCKDSYEYEDYYYEYYKWRSILHDQVSTYEGLFNESIDEL